MRSQDFILEVYKDLKEAKKCAIPLRIWAEKL